MRSVGGCAALIRPTRSRPFGFWDQPSLQVTDRKPVEIELFMVALHWCFDFDNDNDNDNDNDCLI